MAHDTDFALEMTARWEALGITIDALHVNEGGTIVPISGDAETVRVTDDATVPAFTDDPGLQTSAGSAITIGETIGQGGMGLIRVARQHALQREVVVKSIRVDVNQAQAAAHVVGEARVTGMLEHPNIVPIYDIAVHAADEPMIVMKRIEGQSWADLIPPGGIAGRDLDRHLEILRQVANAVHYAHAKGVVHRDLKPDNVMLGRFGEVYVLDWGIAVALAEGPEGVPRASEVTSVAGTPRYMAPEMAAADGAAIGERTDVFLLGAVLYEVLTGSPPHDGERLIDVMASAFRTSPPPYPEGVDGELAAIASRAMARAPDARFPSADAFREAIENYLQRRSSRVLEDQAQVSLVSLEAWLDEPHEDLEDQGRQRAYELLSACRFGFNQALSDWPDNAAARDGLQRALERMVAYELEVGSSRAAAALVAALPTPNDVLAARAEAGQAKTRQAVARLEKLERDADRTIGDGFKSVVLVVTALGWAVTAGVMGYLDRSGLWPMGHLEMILLWAAHFLSILPVAADISRYVEPTRTNVMLSRSSVYVLCLYILFWCGAWAAGWTVPYSMSVNFLLGSALWGLLALVFDPILTLMAICLLAGALAVPMWPSLQFEIMGCVVLSGMGSIAAMWRIRERRGPSPPS